MSIKKDVKRLDEQLTALTDAHMKEIDMLSAAIKDLYMVCDHISTTLRNVDVGVAAIKYSLQKKGILVPEELEKLREKMVEMASKDLADMDKDRDKDAPVSVTMEQELMQIHSSAKKAAEAPYPKEAFIFGGS